MITPSKLDSLLARVKFHDWHFRHGPMGDGFYLQAVFPARDADSTWHTQSTRKWYISPHTTVSEIVHTVMKAILTALEHEARKEFTFDGQPIFHPHHSIEALLRIAPDTELREPHHPEAASQ